MGVGAATSSCCSKLVEQYGPKVLLELDTSTTKAENVKLSEEEEEQEDANEDQDG